MKNEHNTTETIQYYMATQISTKKRSVNLTLEIIIENGITEKELMSVITMERPSIKGMYFSAQPCKIREENINIWK